MTVVSIFAQPDYTPEQFDSALGQHVLLSSTPISWDTWTREDGVLAWTLTYQHSDVPSA